jgi:hypothetical protein
MGLMIAQGDFGWRGSFSALVGCAVQRIAYVEVQAHFQEGPRTIAAGTASTMTCRVPQDTSDSVLTRCRQWTMRWKQPEVPSSETKDLTDLTMSRFGNQAFSTEKRVGPMFAEVAWRVVPRLGISSSNFSLPISLS